MAGIKKVNVCNCNYVIIINSITLVLWLIDTGDYSYIVIAITHQLLVCTNFLFSLYYNV